MAEASWTAAGVVPLRLWRSDELLGSTTSQNSSMSPEMAAKLLELQSRAETAERDRDRWRARHDAVVEDWRLDIERGKSVAAEAPAASAKPAAIKGDVAAVADLSGALDALLQFFDPSDGSVLFQKDGKTLSEAFKAVTSALGTHRRAR
jgi:hypothetical protein